MGNALNDFELGSGGRRKKEASPNAEIMEALLNDEDFGNTCIFRVDGNTEISVQSNTCHGIIDVRHIGKQKCDPNNPDDPACKTK